MRCIFCNSADNKVVDSRVQETGNSIRRRRVCVACNKRFTSYETVEIVPILVVKSDGSRESFNAQKVKNGIVKACEKRPVSIAQIDKIIDSIEKQLSSTLDQEIPSKQIGDMVMEELKSLDEIAYIRFAAVYRQFKDISTFLEFVKGLEKEITTGHASA